MPLLSPGSSCFCEEPCTFCSRRILLHRQINSPHGQGGRVGEVGGEWLVGNTKKNSNTFSKRIFSPGFLFHTV